MKERIDQILIRLGYVTEEEITQALLRQKAFGGRLGSHLLYFRYVTEEQLAHALAEQHRIPAFHPEEHHISPALVNRIPVEVAEQLMVFPLDQDPTGGGLRIVVADPGDQNALDQVKRTLGLGELSLCVAPESTLRRLIQQYYYGRETTGPANQIIELPKLFDDDQSHSRSQRPPNNASDNRNILMVGTTGYFKSFLGPVLHREGYNLHVLSDPKEVEHALRTKEFDHILVHEDDAKAFSSWLRQSGALSDPREISTFSGVASALLDNPVSYRRMARSLIRALQIISELRCSTTSGWIPPYPLICNDLHHLGRTFGLRRLVMDGLEIASYLLIPAAAPAGGRSVKLEHSGHFGFVEFDKSLEFSASLHFPWDITKLLQTFVEYISEVRHPGDSSDLDEETRLAAEILAIVWYRRIAYRQGDASDDDDDTRIKSGLRQQAGRLASLEIIEAYVRILDHKLEGVRRGTFNQIFVVGEASESAERFTTKLRRCGFQTVHVDDLVEAQKMCERQAPAAILVHRESFPEKILRSSRLFKLNSNVLLYAFTTDTSPTITLDLLDAGFDDVFTQPFDFDIISARLTKSVRSMAGRGDASETPGGFTADFKAFSFVELIQALGQSLKTVRISLRSDTGTIAEIHLRSGRIVHAVCGRLKGVEAVYEVIAWRDDGSFTVEPQDHSPPDNVFLSNEAILMEGCRMLDETTSSGKSTVRSDG